VINRGSDQGVQVGMRFAVLNRKCHNVVGPKTGESLGSVEVEKVLVKVVRVEPKLAVGVTFRNFRSGFGAATLSTNVQNGSTVPVGLVSADATSMYSGEVSSTGGTTPLGFPSAAQI
jgi:hypothetical protein